MDSPVPDLPPKNLVASDASSSEDGDAAPDEPVDGSALLRDGVSDDPSLEELVHLRAELVRVSRPTRPTAIEDLRALCTQHRGRKLVLEYEPEVALEVDATPAAGSGPEAYDPAVLSLYACARRSTQPTVVGRLLFGDGKHPPLEVIYVLSGRVYVYSRQTRFLYVVGEDGLRDLFAESGHRFVFEMFDSPAVEGEDCGVPVSLIPLAYASGIEQVRAFVAARVGTSTFRERRSTGRRADDGGYFVVGNEEGLHLCELLPRRVFVCLRDAGYEVIGRGEMQRIVVCNARLEVFVLLDFGRVLKVASTLVAFLRDRLLYGLQPQRRAYAPAGTDGVVCVGQSVCFACDVEYVAPGSLELTRWVTEAAASHRPGEVFVSILE